MYPQTPSTDAPAVTASADFVDETVGDTRIYAPRTAPAAVVRAMARYALQTALGYRNDATLDSEGYEFMPEGPVWGEDGDGDPCWTWSWNRAED